MPTIEQVRTLKAAALDWVCTYLCLADKDTLFTEDDVRERDRQLQAAIAALTWNEPPRVQFSQDTTADK